MVWKLPSEMHKDKTPTEFSFNIGKKKITEKVDKYWNCETTVSPSSEMFKLGLKETANNVN